MQVVRSNDHLKHFPKGELSGGRFVRPFECPERWQHIMDRLAARGFKEYADPAALDMKSVRQIHDEGFLEFLETAWDRWIAEGYEGEVLATCFPARRMQVRKPEHIAQTAQRIVSGGARSAFALCRPPGHHAAKDMYGGYCFLNNAAIAAQMFLNDGAKRVAILDPDFHHGNGTQDIFFDRDDVLFASLHGAPEHAFPHFLGYEDEKGAGRGEGFTVNYAMPPNTGYDEWGSAMDDALKRIAAYSPDALVVSLGVDTFERDPISFFKLKSDDFTDYGSRIAKLKLPTLICMEGGYAVEEIGINTVNVLEGFENG